MVLNEKNVKKFSIILIITALGLLTILVIKPVATSIIWAFILAYIFMPLYKKVEKLVKNKNFAAFFVTFLLLIAIFLPFWLLVPIVLPEAAAFLRLAQTIDLHNIIKTLFPSASEEFVAQVIVGFNSFISGAAKMALEKVTTSLIELPTFLLHLFIVGFVFFFTLRDIDAIKEFLKELSPFNKEKEKELVKHFKNLTNSIVYGQFLIGVVQGSLAGLGFFIFGIKNSLVLTIMAILFAIFPILGPYVVWIPVAVYLFATAPSKIAISFLLYNLIIVSTVDNFLRSYLVSRKTAVSQAIILVGMVGGLFLFGITGMLIGPLVLVYFMVFLRSYKEKTLYTLFSETDSK